MLALNPRCERIKQQAAGLASGRHRSGIRTAPTDSSRCTAAVSGGCNIYVDPKQLRLGRGLSAACRSGLYYGLGLGLAGLGLPGLLAGRTPTWTRTPGSAGRTRTRTRTPGPAGRSDSDWTRKNRTGLVKTELGQRTLNGLGLGYSPCFDPTSPTSIDSS